MKITFVDSGREPQCKPDPDYPRGKDVDLSEGRPYCEAEIPYPAPRCGVMVVECEDCGFTVGVTVAGRVDDPRLVRVPCKKKVH